MYELAVQVKKYPRYIGSSAALTESYLDSSIFIQIYTIQPQHRCYALMSHLVPSFSLENRSL
jgi:hypothetical protein